MAAGVVAGNTVVTQARFLTASLVNNAIGQTMTLLAESLEEAFRSTVSSGSNSLLSHLNENAVLAAREVMLDEYDLAHGDSVRYRESDSGRMKRYTGGVLRNALSSPSFFTVHPRSISMNLGELDKVAKQWHRLNFGVGVENKFQPRMLTFFGQAIGSGRNMANEPSSRSYRMPLGNVGKGPFSSSYERGIAWVGRKEQVDRFLFSPGKGRKTIDGKSALTFGGMKSRPVSFAGSHFLDYGLEELNQQFVNNLEAVSLAWIELAKENLADGVNRGPLGAVGIGSGQAKRLGSFAGRRV